ELGIASADFEFIDVNRSEDVFLDNTLTDEDGVFEVVTVPGHERDKDIAAQSEFAALGARAVSNDLALLDGLTFFDEDFLVDASGSVGTHELANFIDVNALRGIGLNLLFRL